MQIIFLFIFFHSSFSTSCSKYCDRMSGAQKQLLIFSPLFRLTVKKSDKEKIVALRMRNWHQSERTFEQKFFWSFNSRISEYSIQLFIFCPTLKIPSNFDEFMCCLIDDKERIKRKWLWKSAIWWSLNNVCKNSMNGTWEIKCHRMSRFQKLMETNEQDSVSNTM